MDPQPFGLGAHPSSFDKRTYQHPDMGAPLPQTGGIVYDPSDIENQHTVGICTAISLVQNAEKTTGRKYSPDFQYLLQKRNDPNLSAWGAGWGIEGSSIFRALQVGKTYGFLPIEDFNDPHSVPYITEADRTLPYDQYEAKLRSIPDGEVQRLIGLCVNKLSGYAQVQTDPQSIAQAILNSKSGILCRYEVGSEWWTPSWSPADIDPLRAPKAVVSGHAINKTYFDLHSSLFTLANTWGSAWDVNGNAHVNPANYWCTEAWIPYYDALPQFQFTKNLWVGQTSTDVQQLQIRLGVKPTTGYFGFLTLGAVIAYQRAHGITPTGFVGPITRSSLNA